MASDASIDILINIIDENAKAKLEGAQHSLRRLGQAAVGPTGHIKRLGDTLTGAAYSDAPKKVDQITKSMNLLEVKQGLAALGAGRLGAIFQAFASPAGIAVVAIGAVVGVAVKATKAFIDFKKQEIDAHLKSVAEKAEQAAKGWDAYYKAFQAGESKRAALAAKAAAESNAVFDDDKKAADERIKALEKDTAARRQALADISAGKFEAALLVAKEIDDITDMAAVRAHLNRTIESNTRKIEQERGAMVADAKAIGAVVVAKKKENEADKERAAARKKERDDELAFIKQLSGMKGVETDVGMTQQQATAANDLANNQKAGAAAAKQWAAAQDSAMHMVASAFADVGAAAFDQYATAMDRVIDGQNAFGAKSGRAAQNAASQVLRSLGMQAAAQAVFHLAAAAAVASGVGFVNVGLYGTAADNLKAAALFGSVAAMAGVGSAALSVKAPPSGGGSGRGSDADTGTGRGGPLFNITVIGTLDFDAARNLGAQLAKAFSEGG